MLRPVKVPACTASVSPDPSFINPLPLVGIIIGILILRPLKGGGVINHGSTLVASVLFSIILKKTKYTIVVSISFSITHNNPYILH